MIAALDWVLALKCVFGGVCFAVGMYFLFGIIAYLAGE